MQLRITNTHRLRCPFLSSNEHVDVLLNSSPSPASRPRRFQKSYVEADSSGDEFAAMPAPIDIVVDEKQVVRVEFLAHTRQTRGAHKFVRESFVFCNCATLTEGFTESAAAVVSANTQIDQKSSGRGSYDGDEQRQVSNSTYNGKHML